jgi:hypothetical protein
MQKQKIAAILMIAISSIPFYSYADTIKPSCSVEIKTSCVINGSFDSTSLTSNKTTPKISGDVFGAKTVTVVIRKENETRILYKSKIIKAKDGGWKLTVSKKLKNGTYDVELYSGNKTSAKFSLATNTLVINPSGSGSNNLKSDTTFVVASVPLLAGGYTQAGKSTPISYLQITNTGKQSATLKGFWVKQNGSASTESIIRLETVDDKGGSRGASETSNSLFKNGKAFAPTNAEFAPGQTKLFTIKAIMDDNISAYKGKELKIDVDSIEIGASIKGNFPIRGTTWIIN